MKIKLINGLIPTMALLALSTSALANSYCDSRQTQKYINYCYKANIDSQRILLEDNYKSLISAMHYTDLQRSQLKKDHSEWEASVNNQCRSYSCALDALMARNISLQKMIKQAKVNSPQNSDKKNCENLWMSAYRKEVGDDAMISMEQIGEWENWCKAGKTP